ncbi:MAG: ankyrin repeat domain-containing protein [Spirochaetales bacterium]
MEFMRVGFLCAPSFGDQVRSYMRGLRQFGVQANGVTISESWKHSENADLHRIVEQVTHLILIPAANEPPDWMIYLFGYAAGKSLPIAVVGERVLDPSFANATILRPEEIENYVLAERSKWQYQHRIQVAKTRLRGKERDVGAAYEAAMSGDLEMIDDFIAVGMSMDSRTAAGVPLLVGAVRSGNESVVQRVLGEGADPNSACGSGGETALCEAASRGHATIVGILLSHNADPNIKTSNGQTALMLAASQGSADIVSHLISAGADSTPSDSLGMTAFEYARLFGKQLVLDALAVKS